MEGRELVGCCHPNEQPPLSMRAAKIAIPDLSKYVQFARRIGHECFDVAKHQVFPGGIINESMFLAGFYHNLFRVRIVLNWRGAFGRDFPDLDVGNHFSDNYGRSTAVFDRQFRTAIFEPILFISWIADVDKGRGPNDRPLSPHHGGHVSFGSFCRSFGSASGPHGSSYGLFHFFGLIVRASRESLGLPPKANGRNSQDQCEKADKVIGQAYRAYGSPPPDAYWLPGWIISGFCCVFYCLLSWNRFADNRIPDGWPLGAVAVQFDLLVVYGDVARNCLFVLFWGRA